MKTARIVPATTPKEELSRLRSNIEELTKSIFDLVSARQKLSLEVAAVKRQAGIPIENLAVEAKLTQDTVEYSRSLGVDEPLVTAILSGIFKSSKNLQRKEYYEDSIKSFLKQNGIGTVGVLGAGRMGSWFASYFKPFDTKVILTDSDPAKARRVAKRIGVSYFSSQNEMIARSDLIVVAVPMGVTPNLIRKLSEIRTKSAKSAGNKRKLRIIEITSVKNPLKITRYLEGVGRFGTPSSSGSTELYSVHPLFGPDSHKFSENVMIEIRPKTDSQPSDLVESLFPHFRIPTFDAATHDKLMTYVLSLPHLLAMIFGRLVVEEDLDLRSRLLKGSLGGPSFNQMIALSKRVLSESPDIYFEIQSFNPNNRKLLRKMRGALHALEVESKERRIFKESFLKTGKLLVPSH